MPPLANHPLHGARVLVTGGAGFIGSHLAHHLASCGAQVVAFDNLHRAGSELRPERLEEAGVRFVRGDVRHAADLEALAGPIDCILDCSAEPSALAGYDGETRYAIDTNLVGTINVLEIARRHHAKLIFLSTSRVYPIAQLNALRVRQDDSRFELEPDQPLPGASERGVSEDFPLTGTRTLYGTTKLASEMLIAEYGAMFELEYVIDRLGVVTGPGQMGRVEQGVFALWMARHVFGGALEYRGWGGTGHQVRDLLHVADVITLVDTQLSDWSQAQGRIWNAGGGRPGSLSLRETTALCAEISGRSLPLTASPPTHPGDVRVYLTDTSALERELGWKPARDPRATLQDIFDWMVGAQDQLAPYFKTS